MVDKLQKQNFSLTEPGRRSRSSSDSELGIERYFREKGSAGARSGGASAPRPLDGRVVADIQSETAEPDLSGPLPEGRPDSPTLGTHSERGRPDSPTFGMHSGPPFPIGEQTDFKQKEVGLPSPQQGIGPEVSVPRPHLPIDPPLLSQLSTHDNPGPLQKLKASLSRTFSSSGNKLRRPSNISTGNPTRPNDDLPTNAMEEMAEPSNPLHRGITFLQQNTPGMIASKMKRGVDDKLGQPVADNVTTIKRRLTRSDRKQAEAQVDAMIDERAGRKKISRDDAFREISEETGSKSSVGIISKITQAQRRKNAQGMQRANPGPSRTVDQRDNSASTQSPEADAERSPNNPRHYEDRPHDRLPSRNVR
jgi:hypothetical protein